MDKLLQINLNNPSYQVMLVADKYRTTFVISGIIETDPKTNIVKKISLEYGRLQGIVEFTLNNITKLAIEEEKDYGKVKAIYVQLRAFSNKSHNIEYIPTHDFKIKEGDTVHLKIDKEILNLDIEDDIKPDDQDLNQDRIDICFTRVNPKIDQ
ncbi:hypothetical protein [uncultured Tenacibaculum sp.]|uniref:hypothetical protein n=1 Tax=uncultured Tenacibaculum sp. TaxID=174713 RepID=UPI00263864EA|nr:hypothetical protein [uncultured Tenacibaculum sp.]